MRKNRYSTSIDGLFDLRNVEVRDTLEFIAPLFYDDSKIFLYGVVRDHMQEYNVGIAIYRNIREEDKTFKTDVSFYGYRLVRVK